MFYVYKITNKVNNKCYIGSTKHIDKRWSEHIYASKTQSHPSYNYPLQRAFRKYGVDNFDFEMIDSSDSSQKIAELEKEYIIKYNCLTENRTGYNQTLYTDCAFYDVKILKKSMEKTSYKCAWIGKDQSIIEIYHSGREAGRKHNTIGKRISEVCTGKIEFFENKIFRYINIDDTGITIIEPEKISFKYRIAQIDLYTHEVINIFRNKVEAATIGLDNYNLRQNITKCIYGDKGFTQVKGYIWREVDPYDNIIHNNISLDSINDSQLQKVVGKIDCKTNEIISIYNSLAEASRVNDTSEATIKRHILKGDIFKDCIWQFIKPN